MSVLCLGILLGALILPSRLGTERPSWPAGNMSREGACSLVCHKLVAHPTRRQRSSIGEPPSAKGRSQNRLSTAALPYPSAHWHLSVAAHRSPLVLCPSSGVMGYGLGLTIPDMAVLGADLLLPALRATGVVALLPPHVRPC